MTLACTTSGTGATPLFLVHGWGFDREVFAPLLPALERAWRVTRVDLPGHGASPPPAPGATLEDVAADLARVAPPGAVWLGWSLGGVLSVAAAATRPGPRGLCLLATNLRFLAGPDWPDGLEADALAALAEALRRDPARAATRFVATQLRTPGIEPALRERVRAAARAAPPPHPAGLALGLDLLARTDLRACADQVHVPVSLLLGARDTLVPAAAGPAIRRRLPAWEIEVLPGAGHLLFLSHPRAVTAALARLTGDRPADAS